MADIIVNEINRSILKTHNSHDPSPQYSVQISVRSERSNRMTAWEIVDFAESLQQAAVPLRTFVQAERAHDTGHLAALTARWEAASPPACMSDVSDWMQTYSGKKFNPLDPDMDCIDADDIGHALGNLCRYAGHIRKFYSVAEHCYRLSFLVSPENALHALLHDATEAYISDVVRPVKKHLFQYQRIEEALWWGIATRFGVSPKMPVEVIEADTRILLNERAALLAVPPEPWRIEHLEPFQMPEFLGPYGMAPQAATEAWLERLGELWGPAGASVPAS